jgi:hypothetical protein
LRRPGMTMWIVYMSIHAIGFTQSPYQALRPFGRPL